MGSAQLSGVGAFSQFCAVNLRISQGFLLRGADTFLLLCQQGVVDPCHPLVTPALLERLLGKDSCSAYPLD